MPFKSLDSSLPLTPISFEILLALIDAPRHGYAILQHVDARTAGMLPLRTGTLYRALARLEEAGLIDLAESQPGDQDKRRRYYRITPRGLETARAEARRLADQVAAARAHDLLSGSNGQ